MDFNNISQEINTINDLFPYKLYTKNIPTNFNYTLPAFDGVRFVYAVHGRGGCTIGESRFTLRLHEYVIIPMDTDFSIMAADCTTLCINIVSLSNLYLNSISDCTLHLPYCFSSGNISNYRVFSQKSEHNHLLRSFLVKSIDELAKKPIGYISHINSMINMFCILAARATLSSINPKKKNSGLNMDAIFMYINSHIGEEISLDKLADDMFFSKYYLCHEFKNKVGLPLHKYIISKKLTYSKGLVEQGIPITEIYKLCGFGGYSHFLRAFKAEFGISPRGYYKQVIRDSVNTEDDI